MKSIDLKRARRKAHEKRRRNWDISPQRRHELNQLKEHYDTLSRIDPDLETELDLGSFTRRPKKPGKFH